MTPNELHAAVHGLTDVLERENQALSAMDIRRVVALLPEKTAAAAHLSTFGEIRPDRTLARDARRLNDLTRENRRLLERAMAAQTRVIGIVVRAAASVARHSSYGAKGQMAPMTRPMAVSTRA
jgi:hypothetical protein